MSEQEIAAATIAVRIAFDNSGLTDKFRLGTFARDLAVAALQAAENERKKAATNGE